MELAVKVAGLGFRQSATIASLRDALAQVGVPDALATSRHKSEAPVIRELARALGLPLLAVDVEGIPTPTQSARIIARHGTGSVAEAAALGALASGARLIHPRTLSQDRMATAALAEGEPA